MREYQVKVAANSSVPLYVSGKGLRAVSLDGQLEVIGPGVSFTLSQGQGARFAVEFGQDDLILQNSSDEDVSGTLLILGAGAEFDDLQLSGAVTLDGQPIKVTGTGGAEEYAIGVRSIARDGVHVNFDPDYNKAIGIYYDGPNAKQGTEQNLPVAQEYVLPGANATSVYQKDSGGSTWTIFTPAQNPNGTRIYLASLVALYDSAYIRMVYGLAAPTSNDDESVRDIITCGANGVVNFTGPGHLIVPAGYGCWTTGNSDGQSIHAATFEHL